MSFVKKLSNRQEIALVIIFFCIFVLVFGIFNRKNPEIIFINLIGFIILIILLSILVFISEYYRKIDILSMQDSGEYESDYERKFAEYLKRKNITYQLHPKIKLKGKKGKEIRFPDFYLHEFELYVEIWGGIDNPEYKSKNYNYKRSLYEQNKIECIDIYPKNFQNLDWSFTMKILEHFKKRQGIEKKWKT